MVGIYYLEEREPMWECIHHKITVCLKALSKRKPGDLTLAEDIRAFWQQVSTVRQDPDDS